MYMAHTGQTMLYIKDAVTLISQDLTRCRLCSADATTRYREHGPSLARAFYVAGPSTSSVNPLNVKVTKSRIALAAKESQLGNEWPYIYRLQTW